MHSPQEIQDRIVREIEQAGDPFNQFEYLLEKASLLDEMPDERKRADVLVKDCQSQVWLYLHDVDGRPVIEADSDTLMIRGTIQIMKEMCHRRAHQGFCSIAYDELGKCAFIAIV